jgi:hypothetical protein
MSATFFPQMPLITAEEHYNLRFLCDVRKGLNDNL